MRIGSLVGVWRHPVKSMQGERLPAADLGAGGVPGDRAFGVYDARLGRVLSARREPRLLLAAARLLGSGDTGGSGGVELTLPDLPDPVPAGDADEALSGWLGRDVRLVAAPPGGPSFADDDPLHLLSQQAITRAAAGHPGGSWDVRRFRPNLLLAWAEPAYDEEELGGRWLLVGGAPVGGAPVGGAPVGGAPVGGAVVEVLRPCPRCAVTSAAQPGLPRDPAVLATLTRDRGLALGVLARVAVPGRVEVGDPISLVPRR